MKKHFLKLITMLSLIFSLLLVSCQNSFKFSNNQKPKDFVTVYFCNDGFAGRSAGESIFMPEENILARAKKFELSGTYTGNGNFDEEYKKLTAQVFTQLSDLSSFSKDLVAGAWTFTLNAYSEYSETPFYADEVNIEISDISNTVEFNLQPVVQDGGTGQLKLKFNFPENNVTKVSYFINKVTSDQKLEPVHEDSITKNLEDSIVTKSISDLSFGNYMMTISLFSDFTNSENKDEFKDTTFMGDFSVYFVIQTGLVTTVEKTFENLISYWKVTLNGNEVKLKDEVKNFFYYTEYNDVVLPTQSIFDESAASGMLLNGWEDESGNTLTDWKPGEVTGNLTLKASWLPYTDFYVDSNTSDTKETGTFLHPFKTVSQAIAKCTNSELDYTIKLCGNITGAGSTVPISIDSTVKGKSLKICSSDSSVQRIVKAGPQNFTNLPCVKIVDCTLPITFSGLQFMGSQNTSVIYAQKKQDSISGSSHIILENCIIGSIDGIADVTTCTNNSNGIFCKNVKLTLEGCIIKNNKGSGIYMAGGKQPELEIKNTTITNNFSNDGAVRFNNMALDLVFLKESVQIFNNYTQTDTSQQKNLFIENNTNGFFTIDGALDSDSKIGISISDAITLPAVFTKDYSTYVSGKSPDKIFFSDDSSKEITWNAENTEAVIKNKTAVANAYYVAGSDAKVLSAPAEGVTPDGSITTPFTSVQAAVDAISGTESKTGVIYIDGTVEGDQQPSDSETKCIVQITNGVNITILGYTEGSATGGIIKNSHEDTRVIAIWDFDKGTTVTLGANLTVTGGNVTTSNCGGGIVNGATLILDGCTITGNQVLGNTAMGGGVYCNQESVTTIKPDTVISNNTSGKFGGGLTVCGGKLNIEGGTFQGNVVEAADGAGSDIQLKVYEDWTGGVDTGNRQKSDVRIYNDFTVAGTILIGFDDKLRSSQPVLFCYEIKNDYIFDLDPNLGAGGQFAYLYDGILPNVYTHLKISTGDLYVDSEGIIREKTTPGSINIENINRTSVDIGEINSVFFSKKDTANNVIILTLSNKAKAALGVSAYVTFQLYSVYGGNDALISLKNIYITEGTARYQLENLQSIDVGTYKLHVSAVSNNDNYVIESKIFTITVGY